MPSVETTAQTDVESGYTGRLVCPDCNGDPDSTGEAGCETCEEFHNYDDGPRCENDERWNAWDGREEQWAEDDSADWEGCNDEIK